MLNFRLPNGSALPASGSLTIDIAAPQAPPPSPPTPYPGVNRPSWASGVALAQVIPIPGSVAITPGNLFLVNDARANAGMPPITWGAQYAPMPNKYGQIANNSYGGPMAWPNGNGFSPYGAAPDPRNGRVFVPLGDIANYQHTGWCMFDFNKNSPTWTSEVIRTGNHREVKIDNDHNQPGDDARYERNYDGSLRTQHGYWGKSYLPNQNYVGMIGNQQIAPGDKGSSPNIVMGDLATGRWLLNDIMPPRPGMGNDVQDFVRVDHHTGNLFSVGVDWEGRSLWIYDFLNPGSWKRIAGIGTLRPSGSIDHVAGEVLLVETEANAKVVNIVNKLTSIVTLTGPDSGKVRPQWYGGLTYCPHLHAHLFFNYAEFRIYKIARVSGTEFAVTPFADVPRSPEMWTGKLGGVLNDFFSVPSMGGCVLRVDDFSPMMFVGTV